MRRMHSPPQPVSIAFPPDQLSWLTAQARDRRISRSALVRQAVDALIAQQNTPPTSRA